MMDYALSPVSAASESELRCERDIHGFTFQLANVIKTLMCGLSVIFQGSGLPRQALQGWLAEPVLPSLNRLDKHGH